MPTVTFNNEEFKAVPATNYRLKILSGIERESTKPKYGDGKFIGWNLEIVKGYGQPEEGGKISFATSLSFGNKSLAYKFFRAAGMPELDKVTSINTDDYVGQEIIAKIENSKSDDGTTRSKPTDFYSLAEYAQMQSRNLVANIPVPPIPTPVAPVGTPAPIPPVPINLTPGVTNLTSPPANLTTPQTPGAPFIPSLTIPKSTGAGNLDFPKD